MLTPRTMEALSNLHTGLYCRSTYTKDFKPETEHSSAPQETNPPEKDTKSEGNNDKKKCINGGCADSEGEVDSCPCNHYDNEEDVTPLETDMEDSDTQLQDHMTVVPGHMTFTHPSELPDHFRRITSKYTRNKNSLIPCCVPLHLIKKPSLLGNSISPTSLDTFREKETAGGKE